jgi:hypothetical protein
MHLGVVKLKGDFIHAIARKKTHNENKICRSGKHASVRNAAGTYAGLAVQRWRLGGINSLSFRAPWR